MHKVQSDSGLVASQADAFNQRSRADEAKRAPEHASEDSSVLANKRTRSGFGLQPATAAASNVQ